MCPFRYIGLVFMLGMAVSAFARHEGTFGQLDLLEGALKAHRVLPPEAVSGMEVPACPAKSMYARWEGNKLAEGGITLFPAGMEKIFSPAVYAFVERYFLLLALQPDKAAQEDLLRQDRLSLAVNGVPYAGSNVHFCSVLQVAGPESLFTLSADSLHYYSSWQAPGLKVDFAFPKQYDLLLGKDKHELTESLALRLGQYVCPRVPQPVFRETSLYRTALKNVWFDAQGVFLIPQMKGGAYVVKADGRWKYFFDGRFPEESLLNLFSWAYLMEKPLAVDLKVRGYSPASAQPMDMARLTSFMDAEGCKAYVGIETLTEKEITGTVVYLNSDLMYEHLLYFRFPCTAFSGGNTKIEATLYPYIPLNNLKNLYDDASGIPVE